MSHWDRKRAGEIVRMVREVSIRATDSNSQERLRQIELHAMDAERTVSTGPRSVATLLGELCSVCLGDGLSTCPDSNDYTGCNRARLNKCP